MKIKFFIGLYLIVILVAVVQLRCTRKQKEGLMTEGMIEYRVEYFQTNPATGIATSFMPKKMTMKFKHNLSLNNITGFLGMFELENYADARKKTNTTYLKAGDGKFYYTSSAREPLCCFDPYDKMNLEFVPDSFKMIAGLRCNKAIAHFSDKENPDFEIYYTQEIDIRSPNMNTPYQNIDGVLMEFNLKINSLNMHITAIRVQARELLPDELKISNTGYRRISKKSMEKILFSLLN